MDGSNKRALHGFLIGVAMLAIAMLTARAFTTAPAQPASAAMMDLASRPSDLAGGDAAIHRECRVHDECASHVRRDDGSCAPAQ
jgi:hypothetical protein